MVYLKPYASTLKKIMNVNELKKDVIQARKNGRTYSQIRDEFGVPKSTAQDWVRYDFQSPSPYVSCGYVNSNFSRDRAKRFTRTEDEVLEFLQQLSPIELPEISFNNTLKSLTNYCVVGSDFHFGCSDDRAIDIFLSVIDELQPSSIVLNGDTMDFLSISKFPKDLKVQWTLEDERVEYRKFLHTLIEISNGAEIYETVSNHSGASVDGRWRRYLSDRLGELGCLPEILDTLSYENVFMGDYQNVVQHVDHVSLNGLIVTHGTTVRKGGGYSALAEIDKWKTSILHGHTHRIGSSCQRIPAIGGRPEGQLIGLEGGCLCSLDACYGTHLNWQQGFNIVSLGDEPDLFGVEQVFINNGRANITTLGKTIIA